MSPLPNCNFVFGLILSCLAGILLQLVAKPTSACEQPNILWITAEDMSTNLGCYGDEYAATPNLDRFAGQAVRYDRAFATAPVCSPSRSCLITGVYATSLGTQRLRSEFPIPDQVKGFPAYLRQQGYFTTNNVKTDYNVRDEAKLIAQSWDRNGENAHWRQRKQGQPFFSVFNLMTTHQSRTSVWPFEQFEQDVASKLAADQRHDPSTVPLPPYYADTPLVRRSMARYYDCVTVMDQQVGDLLKQLEEDGLAENTIVFFYSDHGMGMPRGKRLLHDSGMRVPLIIRFPEKCRHLAPAAAGEVIQRLVSFVDFAPTVLSLADIKPPDYMQGGAFLGKYAGPSREYVFGARDRVDEVIDLSRSVRSSKYLYIRNFMPHLSWMPPERFSDNAPMRREMKQLLSEGKLNAAQLTYAAPTRSRIEFYDVEADPDQIHNLAGLPEYRTLIEEFRLRQRDWSLSTRDVGFLSEANAWQLAGQGTLLEKARDPQAYPLEKILEVAESVGDQRATTRQIAWLGDDNEAVRYWSVIGLRNGPKSADVAAALVKATGDPSISVRIEAATALAADGNGKIALPVLKAALTSKDVESVLQAMRSLELMGTAARPVLPEIRELLAKATEQEKSNQNPCWMFVRFSAEATMEAIGQ